MNILAHVPLLIAFALVCGCSTPRAVKDLSKQNIQNAKRLATEHAAAVDDYKRFVDFAEQQLETAALQIVEANKAAIDHRTEELLARIDSHESRLIVEFDEQIHDLLRGEFEAKIEEILAAPARKAMERMRSQMELLKAAARGDPGSAGAQRTPMEKELQIYYLLALEGDEENKIRQYALRKALDARTSFFAAVKQRMAKLRERIELQTKDVARTRNNATRRDFISFEDYKAALDKYRETMATVYDTNLAGLQEIDAYLNRASEIQLFLQGAFQGVREVMGKELKSLGPLGEKFNELAQPLVDSGEEQLRGAVEDLEGRAQDYLSNLSSDLIGKLREAAEGVERTKGEGTNANRTNRTP